MEMLLPHLSLNQWTVTAIGAANKGRMQEKEFCYLGFHSILKGRLHQNICGIIQWKRLSK